RMPPGPPPERVVEVLGYDPLAPASPYQDAGEPASAPLRTSATP
ncbi:deacetylase, partial [Corallococcus aberystwythensis]